MTGAVADTLAVAPRECVNVAVCDRRDRDTVKKVGVTDGDAVIERLADGLGVADDVTVNGDADAVNDSDRLGDTVTLSGRVAEALAAAEVVVEGVGVRAGVRRHGLCCRGFSRHVRRIGRRLSHRL